MMLFTLMINAQGASHKAYDSTFYMVIELKAGYTTAIDSSISNLVNWKVSPSIRILWKPNRRLSIGAESAVLNVTNTRQYNVDTDFGKTDFRSGIIAVPIILVFNMRIWELEFYAGTGAALLMSTIESFGKKSKFYDWDNSFMLGFAYHYPISKMFKIGLESSTYYFSQIDTFAGGGNIVIKIVI